MNLFNPITSKYYLKTVFAQLYKILEVKSLNCNDSVNHFKITCVVGK